MPLALPQQKRSTNMAGNHTPVELTTYAKRLPKPKAGHGDGSKSEAEWKALQKILSCLQHRSDLVLETLAALELKVEKTTTTTDAQDTDPEFDTEIRVLNDFPEDWMAGWIQHQTGMAINDRALEKMLVADPAVLDKLRRFSLQLHPQLVMPKSLQIQKLCGRVLDQFSCDIGSPLASTWAKSHIDAAGNISWKNGGPSWGRICELRVPWYLHCSCIVLALFLPRSCIMCACGLVADFVTDRMFQGCACSAICVVVRRAHA